MDDEVELYFFDDLSNEQQQSTGEEDPVNNNHGEEELFFSMLPNDTTLSTPPSSPAPVISDNEDLIPEKEESGTIPFITEVVTKVVEKGDASPTVDDNVVVKYKLPPPPLPRTTVSIQTVYTRIAEIEGVKNPRDYFPPEFGSPNFFNQYQEFLTPEIWEQGSLKKCGIPPRVMSCSYKYSPDTFVLNAQRGRSIKMVLNDAEQKGIVEPDSKKHKTLKVLLNKAYNFPKSSRQKFQKEFKCYAHTNKRWYCTTLSHIDTMGTCVPWRLAKKMSEKKFTTAGDVKEYADYLYNEFFTAKDAYKTPSAVRESMERIGGKYINERPVSVDDELISIGQALQVVWYYVNLLLSCYPDFAIVDQHYSNTSREGLHGEQDQRCTQESSGVKRHSSHGNKQGRGSMDSHGSKSTKRRCISGMAKELYKQRRRRRHDSEEGYRHAKRRKWSRSNEYDTFSNHKVDRFRSYGYDNKQYRHN